MLGLRKHRLYYFDYSCKNCYQQAYDRCPHDYIIGIHDGHHDRTGKAANSSFFVGIGSAHVLTCFTPLRASANIV